MSNEAKTPSPQQFAKYKSIMCESYEDASRASLKLQDRHDLDEAPKSFRTRIRRRKDSKFEAVLYKRIPAKKEK